jgi:hypothetical protein
VIGTQFKVMDVKIELKGSIYHTILAWVDWLKCSSVDDGLVYRN